MLDSHTSTQEMMNEINHMRIANCGHVVLSGWQIGWAQVIGANHPVVSEDAIGYRDINIPGNTAKAICLALADGVGGGSCGEVASAALVDHCTQVPDHLLGNPSEIESWMTWAEHRVQQKLREVSDLPGAATLAAAWFSPDGSGHFLRVGDARLYCFDDHEHCQLTEDQTYSFVGESPPNGAMPDDPARMVGTGFCGKFDIQPIQLQKQQLLLLCSDGLHRALTAKDIAACIKNRKNLGNCSVELVKKAREGGSLDDISVMIVAR